MDEATSALDIRSELLLKEALSNLITKHSVTVSFCICSLTIPALACFPLSIYCCDLNTGYHHCSSTGDGPNGWQDYFTRAWWIARDVKIGIFVSRWSLQLTKDQESKLGWDLAWVMVGSLVKICAYLSPSKKRMDRRITSLAWALLIALASWNLVSSQQICQHYRRSSAGENGRLAASTALPPTCCKILNKREQIKL